MRGFFVVDVLSKKKKEKVKKSPTISGPKDACEPLLRGRQGPGEGRRQMGAFLWPRGSFSFLFRLKAFAGRIKRFGVFLIARLLSKALEENEVFILSSTSASFSKGMRGLLSWACFCLKIVANSPKKLTFRKLI